MESSTVVAFRALVLVACLIVVPLAAIFGSQFPDVVKSVLIDRIFPNGVPGMAKTDPDRDTAPEFKVATTEPTAWQASPPNGAGPGVAAAGQQGTGRRAAQNGSGRRTGRGLESATRPGTPGRARGSAGKPRNARCRTFGGSGSQRSACGASPAIRILQPPHRLRREPVA